MALVIDAGVLIASLNPDDPDHEICRILLDENSESQLVPAPALVEVDHLLSGRGALDSWLGLCDEIADGRFEIGQISPALMGATADLQRRYRDQPIGFVDAAVFVTCERLGERKVATLDHRHFSVLRTKRGEALELLP